MRIAVTRPEEDSGPLQAKLEALGHVTVAAPLLTIAPREGVKIPDRPWQAVAVTSANGIRALPPGALAKTVRMLTVGPQSLKAAREAGFQAEAHGGDVNGLARFIIENLCYEDGPILYLSGQETAGDLEAQLTAARFDCVRIVLYDAVPATALGEGPCPVARGTGRRASLFSPFGADLARTCGTGRVAADVRTASASVPVPQCCRSAPRKLAGAHRRHARRGCDAGAA